MGRIKIATCNHCGAEYHPENREPRPTDSIGQIQWNQGFCFSCAFWTTRLDCKTVIDGMAVYPGDRTAEDVDGKHHPLGCSGALMHIEYTSGEFAGVRISTQDLWHSGEVPEAFREQLPDNAKYLTHDECLVDDTPERLAYFMEHGRYKSYGQLIERKD